MIMSGVLHWLVSQSIFLVALDFYDQYGSPSQYSVGMKSCGFSPIAIIAVLIIGVVMVLVGVGVGLIPYKPGMNLMGSCSAVISAACHNEEWDGIDGATTAREKLIWGVVDRGSDSGVGHCSFTAGGVSFLQKGHLYA